MPDNFASWIGLGISIVVFLGAAWVYLSGSKDKGTIATLEANNKALTDRVVILEAKDRLNEQDKAADRARIAALERENALLLGQRPSADRLHDIETALGAHDTETRKLLRAIVSGINREAGRASDDNGT